ncbi:MAG TPA: hypothetical protein VHW04_10295, partial [Solirubrobacteraceae bacterium]|nr:hypothetical protein [Solirubrobacteraceae bacterium]
MPSLARQTKLCGALLGGALACLCSAAAATGHASPGTLQVGIAVSASDRFDSSPPAGHGNGGGAGNGGGSPHAGAGAGNPNGDSGGGRGGPDPPAGSGNPDGGGIPDHGGNGGRQPTGPPSN